MKPIFVGDYKQLFIDDLLIDYSENVFIRINPPLKTGPVLFANKPWEGHRIGAYGTVLDDNGIYKIWYDSIDNDGNIFHCYAVSRDGIHWEKPSLGLVEYKGNRSNNILPLPPCGTVFIDPVAPREQRYKYVTFGHGHKGYLKKYGVTIWWSSDGLKWNQCKEYALPLNPDTQNQAFWDDRIKKYVAYLRAWNPLRCIARVEVKDILKPWPYNPRPDKSYDIPEKFPTLTTELPIVFKYDEYDPENSDHYNPCVIKYPYARDIYFMFPSAYLHFPEPPIGRYRNDGRLEIQLATSRDGIHWNRLNRETYIRLGRDDELDSGQIYMLVGMIRRGNEIWMYYSGYNYTHGAYSVEKMRYKGAIFRVVQRLDGFTSLDSGYKIGRITTKPLIFKGNKLMLNADTSATGWIKVEIQDEDGRPFKEYSLDACDTIHSNSVFIRVSWNNRHDLSKLQNQPIRLHFTMRNTKLYSFQFI